MKSNSRKSTFALYFGNRGFFPASLLMAARKEMAGVLKKLGHEVILMDAAATRHGAVETVAEGAAYARVPQGATRASSTASSSACPTSATRTARWPRSRTPACRSSSRHTLTNWTRWPRSCAATRSAASCPSWTCSARTASRSPRSSRIPSRPTADAFAAHVDYFDRVCRVVKGMENLVVGAIGASTTAFKTVRIDELALQRHGITMETFDLSDVFARMESVAESGDAYKAKAKRAEGLHGRVPERAVGEVREARQAGRGDRRRHRGIRLWTRSRCAAGWRCRSTWAYRRACC